MRVLHIATRFLRGGSERRLGDVVRALPAPLHSHHLLVGPESRLELAYEVFGESGVSVEPSLRRQPNPVGDAVAFGRIARFIRRGSFDVVHTCQSKAGILGRSAARAAGAPIVLHSLSMANFGPGFGRVPSSVYRAAERSVARWTDAYAVVGAELQARFLAAGISSPDRYHVIRSSVDLDEYEAAARRGRQAACAALALPAERPLVAYVGSLDARKGVTELPPFLAAVHADAAPDALLVVAGEGRLRERLQVDFERLGLSADVLFLGSSTRVPDVLAAAHCAVLFSHAEGLPQVLVQAAAAGTPFVAYPVDGVRELLALGAAGAVVAPGDHASAARAVAEFVREAPLADPKLEEWHPDHVAAQYRALFGGLTAL